MMSQMFRAFIVTINVAHGHNRRTPMSTKRIMLILAVVAVLLLAIFGLRRCGGRGDQDYQTVAVTRGAITQTVTATGTLNPVVNVQVGSQVSGNIQKLFADFNSKVKAGDIVAQIDPVLFQATVTQTEGDLASAQAALELAKLNAARTQELVEEAEFCASRSRSGDGEPSSSGSKCEDKARRTRQGSSGSRALHHHVADRWRGHLAQCRCWPDRGRESAGARNLCDRKRSHEDADRLERG